MNTQPLIDALADHGGMTTDELCAALDLSASPVKLRLRALRTCDPAVVCIVDWKRQGGPLAPVYGLGSQDVPKPPPITTSERLRASRARRKAAAQSAVVHQPQRPSVLRKLTSPATPWDALL